MIYCKSFLIFIDLSGWYRSDNFYLDAANRPVRTPISSGRRNSPVNASRWVHALASRVLCAFLRHSRGTRDYRCWNAAVICRNRSWGVRTENWGQTSRNSRRRNIYGSAVGIRCLPELFNALTPRLGFRSRWFIRRPSHGRKAGA